MDLAHETVDDLEIFRIPGKVLDADTSVDFWCSIEPFVDTGKKVLLDLSQITLVDSSGMGVILACRRHLTASGGSLALCGLSPNVRTMLELVRLDGVIQIYKTREDAIRAVGLGT